MKVNGNGQGKILTPEELRRLFTEGFTSPRDGREANRQGHALCQLHLQQQIFKVRLSPKLCDHDFKFLTNTLPNDAAICWSLSGMRHPEFKMISSWRRG